jgi:hypothetical protein
MDKGQLVKFWQKFFDSNLTGVCMEADYLKLLEELIRGVTMKKANKTTGLFAKMY